MKTVDLRISVPVDDDVPARYVADVARLQMHFLFDFSQTDAGEIYWNKAKATAQESK